MQFGRTRLTGLNLMIMRRIKIHYGTFFPLSFCDLVEALSCRLNRSASVKITSLNAHCLGVYQIYLSEISCIKATKDLFKNTRLMVMSLFCEQ